MKLTDTLERRAATPRLVIPLGFLASLLFVLFGPYANYSRTGYIDPWIYTGYFTNYSYIQHHSGAMYFFSRLPWTIPGLIAFHLATPEVASILLNACLVATSSLSLYFAIRWHYGTVPALLASIALATNPWYFSSVAWDYPDGPAIAYGFLAVAFALRPHGSRALNTMLMAACLALSGFTNMSGGPMVLSILIFPLWRSRRSLVGLLRECACILAGMAGVTLALAPLSILLRDDWKFFMPQIDLALRELGTPGLLTKMWGTGDGFLLKAYHLFPVAFLLVFGLVLWVALRERDAAAWPAYLSLLICSLIYSTQEFVLHGIVLHVPYHSVYLVVPMFVLTGAIFGELWRNSELHREWIPSTALVLFAMSLPWTVYACRGILYSHGLWKEMFVAGAVTILLVAGWRRAPGVCRVALALLLLSLLFVAPTPENFPDASSIATTRENFRTLMSLNEVLKASVPFDRRAIFWFDPDERDSYLFISAQSLWDYGGYDFSRAFQGAVPDDIKYHLSPTATMVQLTDLPEKIVERLKLLDSHGIRYENQRRWTVGSGQSQIYVAAQDITDTSAMR